VGNKFSYADIAFIPWQKVLGVILGKGEYNKDNFPYVKEWLGKMSTREKVKTALESAKPLE
jgi:glutathione S-transferase